MSGSPLIRRLHPDDRAAVTRLLRLGVKEQAELAAQLDPPEDDEFFQTEMAELRAGLTSDPGGWWVALAPSAAVLGCVWLRLDEDRLGPYATVREIVVDSDARCRGVGTELLRVAEAAARDTDAVMLLISGLANNRAIELYRRVGFTDFPSEYREDPNPNHVVLWKPFSVSDPSP